MQEKGSLVIDPEGSQDPTHSRGMMQPRCDYSNIHLFVMTLSQSVLHVEAMIKLLEELKVDHRAYPLT